MKPGTVKSKGKLSARELCLLQTHFPKQRIRNASEWKAEEKRENLDQAKLTEEDPALLAKERRKQSRKSGLKKVGLADIVYQHKG